MEIQDQNLPPEEQRPSSVEPVLEAMLENQLNTGESTTQLLETGVEQRADTNNLLEGGLEMQAQTKEAIEEGGSKVSEAIEKLKPAMDAAGFIANFMAAIKGDKGDKGDTPEKGKDYYTKEEIAQVAQEITDNIRVPEDGKTPEKGVDYFTESEVNAIIDYIQSSIRIPADGVDGEKGEKGDDGKDAKEIDINNIISEVLKKLPKPTTKKEKQIAADDIIELIKNKFSYNDLKDTPTIFKGMAGAGYLREITDVAITVEPTNGQVLKWNSTIKKWVPGTDNDSGGGAVPTFVDNETPDGTIDGVNTAFTLDNSPNPAASLILILNGQYLTQGVEYTLSGPTITFAVAPAVEFSGLPFKAFYRY